jgi:hypothetical protein
MPSPRKGVRAFLFASEEDHTCVPELLTSRSLLVSKLQRLVPAYLPLKKILKRKKSDCGKVFTSAPKLTVNV